MKGIMRIFCILMAIIALQLFGEKLIDIVDETERFIDRTYQGERARRLALDELDKIIHDKEKTDKQKIEEIQKEFLQPKNDDEEITESNAYRLIWTPPLSWDIHSIAIAYDVEKSSTHVISGETLDLKKTSRTEQNEKGEKTMSGMNASGGASIGGGVSWTEWLNVKPHLEAEAHASFKAD